jgi:hypothetical protein
MKIEAALKAPTGSPDTLLSIVSNLTGSEARTSRAMLPELTEKLNDIGQLNGGQIPLHGQLFAQWLHYVEPYKCMYPATVSTQANWYRLKALVTDEQKASYAATLSDAVPTAESAHSSTIITQWSNEEHLPHQDNSIQDASERIMTAKIRKPRWPLCAGRLCLRQCFLALVFFGPWRAQPFKPTATSSVRKTC